MVVEGVVQVFLSQLLLDSRVSFQQRTEGNLFGPALRSVRLN